MMVVKVSHRGSVDIGLYYYKVHIIPVLYYTSHLIPFFCLFFPLLLSINCNNVSSLILQATLPGNFH